MNGEIGPDTYGYVRIIRAFRCRCGRICAMAEQSNGHAALLHETPQCERYAGLRRLDEALSFFDGLEPLPVNDSVGAQLTRSQAHC
jgi:hypothetical protein